MVESRRLVWPVERVALSAELPVRAFLHTVNTVDFHIHPELEILVVVKGKILLFTDGGARTMVEGEVALLNGWQPHATHATDAPNAVLVLQFYPDAKRHDPDFPKRRFNLEAIGPPHS